MLIRHLVLAATLAIVPASPALAAELESLEEVLAKMASTPEQHLALAHYFRGKAEASQQEARIHRSMASTYGGAKVRARQKLQEHCERIASRQAELASDYADLAATHEQEAGGEHAR